METKDTGSSDWPEDEPQTEQKVTLEDYQQLIIQMRRANVQFQQLCNIPSAVSRMLHNLERKGYLEMKSSEEDHRYVKVQFTQAGKKLITEELEKCGTLLERVKERMGEKDMNQFLYYYSEFCSILVDEIF